VDAPQPGRQQRLQPNSNISPHYPLRTMKNLRPSQSLPALAAERGIPFSEPLPRYQYQPLKSNRSIRLLSLIGFSIQDSTIFGSMRDANLDEVRNKYLALSYTWGDAVDAQYYPTPSPAPSRLPKSPCTLVILHQPRDEYHDDIKTIPRYGQKTISGPGTGSLTLTQNLSDFLQMSAADITSNRYEIWIDALCIDQENRDEVAGQILLMGDIYGFAEQVCVWLGAADTENGELRDVANLKWLMDNALPKLAGAYHERGRAFLDICTAIMPTDPRFWEKELALSPPGGITWVDLWVSYFRFFTSRKWFCRAWVVQEVVLAKLAGVIVGQVVVPWDTLYHLDHLVHLPRWGQILSLHEARFPRNLQTQLIGYMAEYTELKRVMPTEPQHCHGLVIPSWNATLSRALMAARLKNATVPGDKILCVLGLVQRGVAKDEFEFILSQLGSTQASAQTLFTACTKLLVEYGGLQTLSLVQNAYLQGIPGLPSWVIDWSVSTAWWPLSRDTSFRSTPPLKVNESFARFRDTRLLVNGMRIDVVTGVHMIYHNVDPSIARAQRFNASDAAFYLLSGAILDVLAAIGPFYPLTGTPAEDVLWHTLLFGAYENASPSPHEERQQAGGQQETKNTPSSSTQPTPFCTPTPKHSCLEYLAFQLASTGLPDMPARITAAISALENTPSTTTATLENTHPPPEDSISPNPNSGLITALKTALHMREKARAVGGGHFHASRGAAAFATQMIMKLKYRKMLSTAGGRAGVCGLPVEVGDEVWLLKGLPYPVIVRPRGRGKGDTGEGEGEGVEERRKGGKGEYVFMGDAYVYGVMYGEVEERDGGFGYEGVEIV